MQKIIYETLMPKLVRLYIRHCLIGFALSGVFCALLFWFDIGNLWHLVTHSDVGVLAAGMLFFANGIVFAGAQFGISVMRMGDDQDPAPPRGSRKLIPILVRQGRADRG